MEIMKTVLLTQQLLLKGLLRVELLISRGIWSNTDLHEYYY